MNDTTLGTSPVPEDFQAIVSAPGFSIGIRCGHWEIHEILYLEPCAEQAPTNSLAAEAVRQLRAYLADSDQHPDLPLRLSGTAFQRRVWEQISTIPNHQTRTYGEVAKALRNAPRAVGQACGSNPYPIIVPCHRVVASGGLGGFGGTAGQRGDFLLGIKRWLLAHEGH